MKEYKILFLTQESLIQDLVTNVYCCKLLVFPFNVDKIIYPYEHLLNLSFVENDSYIAGVSNPIFLTRKDW